MNRTVAVRGFVGEDKGGSMDLSGLKWPLIVVVVVFLGWLCTTGGVNWMITKSTTAVVGQDAEQDMLDEARLTKLAGFVLWQFKYEKAGEIMMMAIDRYGENGPNFLYNQYRLVKCYEKVKNYQKAHDIIIALMNAEASQFDDRIPERDNLALRAEKLKETHELR